MTANEVLKKTVLARINGNKSHGWGIDDSSEVVKAICQNEYGKPLSADALAAINSMINPSQARQSMEKNGLLKETPKGQRKPALLASLFADSK